MATQTTITTHPLDEALARFRETDIFYGPGYVSHGPMAVEALDHMGHGAAIDDFVREYMTILDPASEARDEDGPDDWQAFVQRHATRLAPAAAALAGHGLLRLAHATRALEREDTPARRADLVDAVAYWSTGDGVATPEPAGELALAEALDALPRLAPMSMGLISEALELAAQNQAVAQTLASLAPPTDLAKRLDDLALASVDRYLANGDGRSFTFIHGVTVSTMAAVLLPYLDLAGQRSLVNAVTGFVLLAVVGYDQAAGNPEPVTFTSTQEELTAAASVSGDDHTIKFTDALMVLAERTGATAPLAAAEMRRRASASS